MLESSRAWAIFVMLFISLFEIIKVVAPEPCILIWILASITEGAALILNGAKTLFSKGVADFISGIASLYNNDPNPFPLPPSPRIELI